MKKVLCALICIVLVASVFTACGETENTTTTTQLSTTTTTKPTTTSTTEKTTAPKNDLGDYVGYWFVDTEDMYRTNYGTMYLEWGLYISESHGDGVAVELYNGPYRQYRNDYLKVDPETKKATFEVEWHDGTVALVFQPDRIVCTFVNLRGYSETIQFKAHYPGGEEEKYSIHLYDKIKFEDIYNETYWYAYERDENGNVEIGELHIRKATTDNFNYTITFDCSFGDYKVRNVTANIVDDVVNFPLGDGKEGILNFTAVSEHGYNFFNGIFLAVDGETVCNFADRTVTRVTGTGKNRDLTEYIGYWYYEDVDAGDIFYMRGTGISEIHIKKVEGNKVTFGFNLADAPDNCGEDITVEINGNLGIFEWEYMGNAYGDERYQCKGVIRFERDGIYLHTGGTADMRYTNYLRYSVEEIRWGEYYPTLEDLTR